MHKAGTRVRKPFSVRLLNVLIVLMLIVAAAAMTLMLSKLREANDRDRYGLISYAAQDGEYADMVRNCFNTSYDVEPFPSEHEEAYQVGLYADAAFQHLYFRAVGNEQMEARCEEKMANARSRAGEMGALADEIDTILSRITLHP